jgi:hypothetical protein
MEGQMKRLVILLAGLALLGCSPAADTKAAEDGVTAFHRMMDAGQYAAIYDASAPDMKSAISRVDFVKLLTALHAKLGSFNFGKTTNWNDNANTGGHHVTLTREAQFERGPGTEEFVFRIENGHAVLAGYHVNSNVLVTG